MPNVTPPLSNRAPAAALGSPLRGTLKGALATLVLLLLALLFWQLLDQLRETQKNQRQYTIDYTADLASQVSLNMALNAQIALNLLPIVEQPQSADEQQALLRKLQQSLPDLRSLALLSPSGKILSDSAADSQDADYLVDLVRRSRAQAHYFSNADDGSVVHLLLHQASGSTRGYWALRLTPTFFSSLTKQGETGIRPLWLVENRINHQIISRDEALPTTRQGTLSDDDLANSVLTVPLSSSDWQLRGLFDRQQVLEQLLPAFIGKCLLGLAFSLLPFIALLNMRRRQRQLHEGRRRYQDIFEGTGVALCVLDLSGLKSFFDKAQLNSSEQLKAWLDVPEQRQQLLQELRITEVNQVALQLLNVNSCDQAWKLLIDGCPLDCTAIGNQVLEAVLNQQKQLELEIKLQDTNGRDQHLWLVLRLPEEQHDYKAVILSINDITSRSSMGILRPSARRQSNKNSWVCT
ncbi:MAG: diguanylate phosphodiesterase, partial [Pseudomonas sp.]